MNMFQSQFLPEWKKEYIKYIKLIKEGALTLLTLSTLFTLFTLSPHLPAKNSQITEIIPDNYSAGTNFTGML